MGNSTEWYFAKSTMSFKGFSLRIENLMIWVENKKKEKKAIIKGITT